MTVRCKGDGWRPLAPLYLSPPLTRRFYAVVWLVGDRRGLSLSGNIAVRYRPRHAMVGGSVRDVVRTYQYT